MGVLYVLGTVGFLSGISPGFMSLTETVVLVGFGLAILAGVIYAVCVLISDAVFNAWLRADNARLLAERDARAVEDEDQAEHVGGGDGER